MLPWFFFFSTFSEEVNLCVVVHSIPKRRIKNKTISFLFGKWFLIYIPRHDNYDPLVYFRVENTVEGLSTGIVHFYHAKPCEAQLYMRSVSPTMAEPECSHQAPVLTVFCSCCCKMKKRQKKEEEEINERWHQLNSKCDTQKIFSFVKFKSFTIRPIVVVWCLSCWILHVVWAIQRNYPLSMIPNHTHAWWI